jgi:hypothetical protein
MKSSDYYLARIARLRMLPPSVNLRRKMSRAYRAAGDARQREIALARLS